TSTHGRTIAAGAIVPERPALVRDRDDVPIFADTRNRSAVHILNPEAHLVQYAEKTRARRARQIPRERMHFHQDRLGTPAILRQDISCALENLLLETLNVDFDEIYSPAGEGVVERNHR